MYSDAAYAPFGEAYAQAGTTDLSFTGMNQDTVANLYDFPAREYGIQGRWPSPDPAGIAAVNPTDPQSWNRYAYARNSPLMMIDPLGLDAEEFYDCFGSGVDAAECAAIWLGPPDIIVFGGDNSCNPNDPLCEQLYEQFLAQCTSANPCTSQPSASGGGGAPQQNGLLKRIAAKVCSALPQGQVLSAGGGTGGIGSPQGSISVVTNYNTGQTDLFFTGGGQLGWNGGASGYVSGGYIFSSSSFSNSMYSGKFTTISGSAGAGPGGALSSSSNGVSVVSGSMGASLLGGTGGVSQTWTSQPVSNTLLSSFLHPASSVANPATDVNTLAKMACNALAGGS